jgi:enamine deaminase RidA (YjgF/YER057c/UK114 family)
MGIDERLRELSIELPESPQPVASYVPVVITGTLAFVSGQVPLSEGKVMWNGKVGGELSLDEATQAARRCALQALAALRAELGTLDRVARIVKVSVFVASAPGFTDQPKVANGASDLLAEVFGDAGIHARAAVGVAELPLGAPVEVELVAELAEPAPVSSS